MNDVKAEFTRRIEEQKKIGLIDIKYVIGDISDATVESFIEESEMIDKAIELGKHSPLVYI